MHISANAWKLACYAIFVIVGGICLLLGRAHASYWGPTEGVHVRIGGALILIWAFWGLWLERKRK